MRRLALFAALMLGLAAPAAAERLEVLIEENARQTHGAEWPDSGKLSITVQGTPPEDVLLLSAFWMDAATGQFLANAVLPDGRTTRVSGLALLTVPTPVPARRLMPDEIITEADLVTAELPFARVGAFAVTDRAALVGKQVRRLLTPGRPVMAQSVIEPLVIDRGDRVQIIYRDGALELAAPGRALQDAHRGQDVRIVNLVSNNALVGTAAGEGRVEVTR